MARNVLLDCSPHLVASGHGLVTPYAARSVKDAAGAGGAGSLGRGFEAGSKVTVAEHHLAIHPGKAELFCTETIYCGLRVNREGIGVDPDRLTALRNVSPPQNVGDVWQFNAAAGWIRRDNPLFSERFDRLAKATKRCQDHKMVPLVLLQM